MSERKVLNKYYPPDFDPSKIPRCKVKRDGKFGIRLMAPFNMRCNTCGEYIYKGKKFNSRKENVDNENYLGLHIFRFYIKCPRCVAEIVFKDDVSDVRAALKILHASHPQLEEVTRYCKEMASKTDPENTDYTLEAGATRNFEALRTAERLARQEMEEKEEEEKNNPMKLLENRTKASLQEMDMIETLEELRDLRARHSGLSLDEMIKESVEQQRERERQQQQREQDEDESFVQSLFGPNGSKIIKRIESDDDDDDDVSKEETRTTRVEQGTRVSGGLKRSEDSSVSSTSNKKIKYSSDNPIDYLTQDFPPPTSSSSTVNATSSSHTKTLKTSEAVSSKKTTGESAQNKEKSSQRNLLAGLVVRAKGKEPLNKSSTVTSAKSESSTVTSTSGQGGGSGGTGTSGGAVKEDVGPVKPSSSGAGLDCLASYSSSDSDSDS